MDAGRWALFHLRGARRGPSRSAGVKTGQRPRSRDRPPSVVSSVDKNLGALESASPRWRGFRCRPPVTLQPSGHHRAPGSAVTVTAVLWGPVHSCLQGQGAGSRPWEGSHHMSSVAGGAGRREMVLLGGGAADASCLGVGDLVTKPTRRVALACPSSLCPGHCGSGQARYIARERREGAALTEGPRPTSFCLSLPCFSPLLLAVDGDPHFVVDFPLRNLTVCFNIDGRPGDIVRLISDHADSGRSCPAHGCPSV